VKPDDENDDPKYQEVLREGERVGAHNVLTAGHVKGKGERSILFMTSHSICIAHVRPHRTHELPTIATDDQTVCQTVCRAPAPCKNGCTDRGPV